MILLSDDSLDSAYRPSGIYREAHESVLDAAADAIGQAAGNSFLVARITAATEATATRLPDPKDITWRQGLPRRAGPGMYRDLRQRLGKEAARAEKLLLPLAYAQGSGMPWEDLWPRLANKLSPGDNYDNDDLVWLRTAAGSYAVESRAEGRSVYRLYHQALTDYLREKRGLARRRTCYRCCPSRPGPPSPRWRPGLGKRPPIHSHPLGHPRRTTAATLMNCSPNLVICWLLIVRTRWQPRPKLARHPPKLRLMPIATLRIICALHLPISIRLTYS